MTDLFNLEDYEESEFAAEVWEEPLTEAEWLEVMTEQERAADLEYQRQQQPLR